MSLSIKKEEQLSEIVKELPELYGNAIKAYKEKDELNNAWRSVTEKFDFVENGN